MYLEIFMIDNEIYCIFNNPFVQQSFLLSFPTGLVVLFQLIKEQTKPPIRLKLAFSLFSGSPLTLISPVILAHLRSYIQSEKNSQMLW